MILESTSELVGIVSHSRGHIDFARPSSLALPLIQIAPEVWPEVSRGWPGLGMSEE